MNPGLMLDIFNSDAFSFTALTRAVNRMPFVPHQAGDLGIFEEQGIATTTMAVEMIDGVLNLIANTRRGAPAETNQKYQRKVVNFSATHLPTEDTIQSSEIQNVRDFGSTDIIKGAQTVVQRRLQSMLKKHDATVEFQRVKALQGLLLDADGTVLYNLYTAFQKQQSLVDFLLGTSTTDIHGKCEDVLDVMEDNLGAFTYDHIHVFCGRTWFKNFVGHPNVQKAYQYFMNSAKNRDPLKDDVRYGGFAFGGLVFEKYRGKVSGQTYVADNEAYAFPVGGTASEFYQTVFAPGDFFETANTIGLPRYAKVYVDIEFQRFLKLHVQSNPISIMNRPEGSIKLWTST